jgi:hypothetical protein
MKVHLIRSKNYNVEDFNNVLNILRKNRGSIEFVPSEPIVIPESLQEEIYDTKKDFETQKPFPMSIVRNSICASNDEISFPHKRNTITWEELFNVCKNYRRDSKIDENDHVLLLNDIPNENNWFGCVDSTKKNYFVQTNDWDWYLGRSIDTRFPVAYEIVSWLLRSLMYKNQTEIISSLHKESKGCMMDYCIDKTQIIIKMRTADLCPECLKVLENRDINRTYARQLFQIMDGLRDNIMFRQRSQLLMQLSKMEIRGLSKTIYLTDLGDLQINLNPKERALYLLYLNHPEGIQRSYLIDYKDELRTYYAQISNQATNELIDIAINRLVDVRDNNMNEVMARIRSKFKNAVGEEQAKDYSITFTPEGTHKILLNRELVGYEI